MTARHTIGGAALAAAMVLAASACGTTTEGGGNAPPTTRVDALSAEKFCALGKDVSVQVSNLDQYKPEFLAEAKKAFKRLQGRGPDEVRDDINVYVDYVNSVQDLSVLEPEQLPADLKIVADRIDVWWKQNCGSAFGS